jgi:hypothetical protein
MDKTNTLILLVRSLSKGERRYFRLYSTLQEGGKDYMDLFEIIETGMEANTFLK